MRCTIFYLFSGIVLSCLSVNTCSASDECDFLIRADVMFDWYPPVPPPPPDELAYDDFTAHWLTWAGLYRGTYFIPEEFYPSNQYCLVEGVEFWFYHHTGYPWDTSQFFAELWEGAWLIPYNLFHVTEATATHYSAVTVEYPPDLWVDGFWIIENTELSAGGWPSLLGDNSPNFTGESRSFYSDDFIIWLPWLSGEISTSMESFYQCSWATVKSLFR